MRADISSVPTWYGHVVLKVMVLPSARLAVVPENTHVSWASGKLASAGAPIDVVAHAVAVHSPPAARFQYTVFGLVKVIPELPLQSPKLDPVIGAAAPVIVMSLKSTLSPEKALHVSVTVVPTVLERMNVRRAGMAPADTVRVPVIVALPGSLILRYSEVGATKDKFLKLPNVRILGNPVAPVKLTS